MNLRPALSITRFDVIPYRWKLLKKIGTGHSDQAWGSAMAGEVTEISRSRSDEELRSHLVHLAGLVIGWIEDIDTRQFEQFADNHPMPSPVTL